MKHGHTTAFVMDNGSNNMTAVVEMKVMDDTISVDRKRPMFREIGRAHV